MPPVRFCGSLFVHMLVFLWHQPHLHLEYLTFPLGSGCASPVSCGRASGVVPRQAGGLDAAGQKIPRAATSLCFPPGNGIAVSAGEVSVTCVGSEFQQACRREAVPAGKL